MMVQKKVMTFYPFFKLTDLFFGNYAKSYHITSIILKDGLHRQL